MLSRITSIVLKKSIKPNHFSRLFSSIPTRTALVTGGNRGIGLETCKLFANNNIRVIMGTRDLTKGTEALKNNFSSEATKNVSLLQLDLNDPYSISNAVKHIESNYDELDILVNNAGRNGTRIKNKEDKIHEVIKTNYYGTKILTDKLLPFMNNTRIVTLSTRDCALRKCSDEIQKRFLSDDLDENGLTALMEEYKKDALNNLNDNDGELTMKQGWINSPYLMSSIGINIYCKILGKKFAEDDHKSNWIASYCPGHCATESFDYFGDRDASEGAFGAVTLSTMFVEDKNVNNGEFWAAFFESDNLESVQLEIMDLINPSDTVSWGALCDMFVTDEKIQSFE